MKLLRLLIWTAAAVALVAVFAADLRPVMAVTLANQLWNCF